MKYTSARANRPVNQIFATVMAPWAFKTVKFLGVATLVWLIIFTALPGSTADARSTAATISDQSARKLKSMSTIDVRNHLPRAPGKRNLHKVGARARERGFILYYGRVPCARPRCRVQNNATPLGAGDGVWVSRFNGTWNGGMGNG